MCKLHTFLEWMLIPVFSLFHEEHSHETGFKFGYCWVRTSCWNGRERGRREAEAASCK